MTKQEIANWLEKEIAAHEEVQKETFSPDLNIFIDNLKETYKFVKGCCWMTEPEIKSSDPTDKNLLNREMKGVDQLNW